MREGQGTGLVASAAAQTRNWASSRVRLVALGAVRIPFRVVAPPSHDETGFEGTRTVTL